MRDGKKSGSGINIPDPQHWYYDEPLTGFFLNLLRNSFSSVDKK
jgi:hypothetical protein